MSTSATSAVKEADESARLADEAETAEYIGDLVSQLERLARTHGLVRLQYLLAACREEAHKLSGAESAA